ncbi:C2 domain [Trinorchestia longiramus]|nr:C2 domain [Trinorchestia longiramus]
MAEARGLSHPHQPFTSLPHVYVRVLVWREKRGIRKIKTTHLHVFRTRTIRHCSDPVFREDFVADVGRTDIKEVVVRLVVEAADRLVCPTVLGELTLAMRHLPPASLIRRKFTRNLSSPRPQDTRAGDEGHTEPADGADESPPSLTYCLSPPSQDLGNILLSASFLPTAQRLSICVIKATDLRYSVAADSLSEFYPYVRVLLLSKGRLLKKKKTGYCSHTVNPQWNQTLIFSLQLQQVESVSIVVCVCSRQPVAGSADLNGVKASTTDKKVRKMSSDRHSTFDETTTNNNSLTKSLNEYDTIDKKNLANMNENGMNSNKASNKNGDAGDVGRGGERYVGKVVFGAHVKLAQTRDFYRAIIQSPRTQHTQWQALR